MKDVVDPFFDLGMTFQKLVPFPKLDPYGDEKKRLLGVFGGQRTAAIKAGAYDALERIRRNQQDAFEGLFKKEGGLLYPWDLFRAAFDGYLYSHSAQAVVLNRLRRQLEIPLDHPGTEEEELHGGWTYLQSDVGTWLFTAVHQADLLSTCLPFMLDPSGSTSLFSEPMKLGFKKGFTERPRDQRTLNQILRSTVGAIKGIDAASGTVLERAQTWYPRIADLRNDLAHGWIRLSIAQSQWTKQWVLNCYGWGHPDQVIDLESFIARATYRQWQFIVDISKSLGEYLSSKIPGFKVESLSHQRSDSRFYATVELWRALGKDRQTSIALRIHEKRHEEARTKLEKLSATLGLSSCGKGHTLRSEIQSDNRRGCLLSLRCECGLAQISESLEYQFSREFMENSADLAPPSTIPRWIFG